MNINNWVVYDRHLDGHRVGYVDFFCERFEATKANKLKNLLNKNVVFSTLDGNELHFVFMVLWATFFRNRIIALSIRPHEKRKLLINILWTIVLRYAKFTKCVSLITPVRIGNKKFKRSILSYFEYFPDPEYIMDQEEYTCHHSNLVKEKKYDCIITGAIKKNKNTKLFSDLALVDELVLASVGKISDSVFLSFLQNVKKTSNLTVVDEFVSLNKLYEFICLSHCVFCLYEKDQSSGIVFKSLSLGVPVLIWKDTEMAKYGFEGCIEIKKGTEPSILIEIIRSKIKNNKEFDRSIAKEFREKQELARLEAIDKINSFKNNKAK